MRITVKRVGGYAGLEDMAQLDTSEVDPASASEVEQLVDGARFFDLPENPWPEDVGADLIRYDIVVAGDEREHTVAFLDDGNPEKAALRTLAERVLALGRSAR